MELHPLYKASTASLFAIPAIEYSRPHEGATKLVPKSPSSSGHEANLSPE